MPSPKIHKKYLILLSVLLFLLFIFFSYLVAKERLTQWDFDMTVKLQDRIPRRFDYPFSTLSVMGSAEVTGAIWFLIFVFLLVKRFWLAAVSQMLLPLAMFIEIFGKVFVHHPAPPYLFYRGVIKFSFPSSFVHTDYSYPSGHMTRTAFIVTFIVVYLYLRFSYKTQIVFLPLLVGLYVTMAISRIYLGEHWSSDVIGGALIGSSFGVLSALFVPHKKIQVQTPQS